MSENNITELSDKSNEAIAVSSKEKTEKILLNIFKFLQTDEIVQDIVANMSSILEEKSFMQADLKLTEQQKEVMLQQMRSILYNAVNNAKAVYLEEDKNIKEIYSLIKEDCKHIARDTLIALGDLYVRGACVPATINSVVSKDKKQEFTCSFGGRAVLSVPSCGVYFSTNLVEDIQRNIDDAKLKKE